MPSSTLSIVIPNWQGEEWIARGLSALQVSARRHGGDFEIIVVDDASTDGSAGVVETDFPRARLIRNRRNIGFAASVMQGARAATGRVLLLCNNDLCATEEFVPNLMRWFDAGERAGEKLFAVSARTLGWWDGKPNQVCMGAVWQGCRITPSWEAPAKAKPCLFVQAGAAAYDRKLFLKLGGLREFFAPGYWEDYDLSYRAAKAGYQSLYDPEAVALHVGGGSMTKRYGADAVEAMKARNHLLFEWANLTDPGLLASHLLRLPLSIAREWLSGGEPRLTRAVLAALRRAPAILGARADAVRRAVATDREVLTEFGTGTPSF